MLVFLWNWVLTLVFGEWTPFKIANKKCVRCDRDRFFVAAMDSPKNTSTIFAYVTDAVSLCHGVYVWYYTIYSSKGCSSSFTPCNIVLITSLAVSDPQHEKGGNSYHPFCRQFGTTNSISSMFSTLLIVEAHNRSYMCLCHWLSDYKSHIWCLFLRTWKVPFFHNCPQVWR